MQTVRGAWVSQNRNVSMLLHWRRISRETTPSFKVSEYKHKQRYSKQWHDWGKKNEQKNKTTQVSPAGFDMTRGSAIVAFGYGTSKHVCPLCWNSEGFTIHFTSTLCQAKIKTKCEERKKNESKAATECVTLMLTMSVTANWLTRWAALAETLCWMPVWQKRPLKACCFHSSVCKLNVWLDRLCSRLHAACRPNDSI